MLLFSCKSSEPNKLLSELQEINSSVNSSILYEPDFLVDYWQTPSETELLKRGDCEDFAILKSSKLSKTLFWQIWLVEVPISGEQHAILVVDDMYILDNKYDSVYTVKMFPYIVLAKLPYNSTVRPIGYTENGTLIY